MILNPLSPLVFLKVKSLKASVIFLLILLIKSNLLRLKGGIIGGLFALILISGILISTSITIGSLFYAYQIKTKSKEEEDPIQNLETIEA